MTTIPTIIATALVAAPIGFLVCAFFMAGKVGNVAAHRRCLDQVRASYTLCNDGLTTAQRKIDAIRTLCDQPRAIRKAGVRAILGGDA